LADTGMPGIFGIESNARFAATEKFGGQLNVEGICGDDAADDA
jgi:hypothetical protein